MTDKQRAQLIALGIDPDTGRKIRSDKGQPRGKVLNPDDKRLGPSSKMDTFHRVMTRLRRYDEKRASKGEQTILGQFDENGYFCIIPETFEKVGGVYQQRIEGRVIVHSIRKVRTQKELDLEKYRFEGFQEWAFSEHANEPAELDYHGKIAIRMMLKCRYCINDKTADECMEKRKITWFELFCELYYLDPMEASLWDYETWLSHYKIAPAETLPDDFVFHIKTPPGTPEFMPEWQYRREKLERQQEEAVQAERERKRSQFLTNMGIKPRDVKATEEELRAEALRNKYGGHKDDSTTD